MIALKIINFKLNEIGGRKNVEDAIMPKKYAEGDAKVFLVCDGVGGSNFGEVASELASSVFYATMVERIADVPSQFVKLVQQSVVKFKSQVEQYLTENPAAQGTSTTLTLAVVVDDKAYVAWCGDSRIYQIRDGKIHFKSQDHSLVSDLISQGIITEEQALTHPQRNVITRSLNSHTKPSDVETAVLNLKEGDWLLMCTDCLLEQFKESKFDIHLKGYKSNLDYADYINKMCEGRTSDNYSMHLLYFKGSSLLKSLKYMLGLILVAAISFFATDYVLNDSSKKSSTSGSVEVQRTTPLINPEKQKAADTVVEKGTQLNKLVK